MTVVKTQNKTTMSCESWLNYIRNARKSSITTGAIQKVSYVFDDGAEMLEEYNIETTVLMRRAWKKKEKIPFTRFNDTIFDWDIELGDMFPKIDESNFFLKESTATPILSKRLTQFNIEWRIRNIPYPLETYLITTNENAIIVRTTNKKYFKEIPVHELIRCGLSPEQNAITVSHQQNTLIISYVKPALVKQMEYETLRILQNIDHENEVEAIY